MILEIKEGKFELVNDSKALIAQNGDGNNFAGFGEDAEKVIAEYDKRGGLIKFEGKEVKTGCFYDFIKKAPKEEIVIEYEAERVIPENTEEVIDDGKKRKIKKIRRSK